MLKDFIDIEDATIDELYEIRNETDDEELKEMIDDIIYEREEYGISYDELSDLIGGY